MSLSVINLPVPVGKFEPKRFNLADEFRLIQARCEPNTIKQGSYGKGKLYNKELLHAQRVAFETAVSGSESPLLPFIYKVGKDRCLVQSNEKTQAGIGEAVGKSYSALVVAWEGRGFPPDGLDEHLEDQVVTAEGSVDEVMDDEDLYDILSHRQNAIVQWKRFGHEDNRTISEKNLDKEKGIAAPLHHTGLRFRWTRVELYPYTDKFNSHNHMQRLTDELEGVDVHKLQLYHVKLNLHEIAKATLPQLIYQVVDNTHMNERYFTQDMVRTLLGAEHKDKNVVLHTKKFYDMDKDRRWNVQDVQLVQGTERMLTLNAEMRVLLQQTTCYKLFMYNGLASDLLLGYFGVPATKYDSTYHKYITKALRGRLVRISGIGEKRTIFAISEHDASMVSDADKHDAWLRRKDRLVEHPKLLCLDLGSQGKPALIPPELCVIEPHQSFTGKQTTSLQRELRRLQQDLILPSEEVSEDAYIEEFSPRKHKITELDKELSDAFPNGVRFIFVEAGAKKLPDTAWATFRQAVKGNKIFKRRDMVVSAEAPISLKYQPEASSDDMQATKAAWRAQLLRLMGKQGGGVQDNDKKQAVIVIASIQNDQHNRDIYRMLKYIAECEVGLQSFAVNISNVNRLARKFQNDGGRKVANEVINRMRICNPLDSSKAEQKDIAVALHIECKLVDHLQISDGGSYDYKTKVHKLMSQSEMDQYNPAGHVLDFVKQVLPSNSSDYEHRITVLRTGFMPPISKPPVSMHPGRKAEQHVHFDARYIHLQCDEGTGDDALKEGTNITAAKQGEQDQKSVSHGSFHYFDHSSNNVLLKQASGYTILGSRAETANREMGHIYTKLLEDNRTAKAKVSYILLSEDDDFKLTQEAKERIAKRCQDRVEDKDDGKGGRRAKAVFFIADTKVMNNDRTVGVHRNAASGNATLVKAELLGEKLSDEQDQSKGPDPDEALRWTTKKILEENEEKAEYEHWRKMLDKHTTRGMLDEHDKRVTPDEHERRQSLQPPPNFGHQLQIRQRPSSSSLASSETTANSDPQHDSTYGSPTKSLRSKTSKLALTSTHDKDVLTQENDTPQISPTSDIQTAAEKKTAIADAELRRLAQLWMYDRMEMYSTKWPVPTHLAYLAAKRAWMHLRKDDWEDPDNGTAPLVLVPVKEEVEKSLCYL
ncbi:hypothetical protein EJ03DRAFT_355870 [Teratosphaeria nubilosa]|uniref:PAZ domain-containing protein n=1 Tax=Teratosphaeria nubilosa TaxID=161662 RepID=A0A6G1KUR3_9PEZI|nr:hypothetical protein EJ03DRAFT_355870 [Teratosphaeria nubilosa]